MSYDDLRARLRRTLEETRKPFRAELERRRPDLRWKSAEEILTILGRERRRRARAPELSTTATAGRRRHHAPRSDESRPGGPSPRIMPPRRRAERTERPSNCILCRNLLHLHRSGNGPTVTDRAAG